MPYDVFISHSKEDKLAAQAICARFEAENVRCWIAPRDVPGGSDWAESIITALNSCRVMVLVFSAKSNESPQVRREVQRAFEKGLVVMPFRIEDVSPNPGLEYYIGSVQWLDALTPPLESYIGTLLIQVKALLLAKGGQAKQATAEAPPFTRAGRIEEAPREEAWARAATPARTKGKNGKLMVMVAVLAVVCMVGAVVGVGHWQARQAAAVAAGAFRDSLLKVVSASENHFVSIRGEYIGESGAFLSDTGHSNYASTVSFPQSIRTQIGEDFLGSIFEAYFVEHSSDLAGAKTKYDELVKAVRPALPPEWTAKEEEVSDKPDVISRTTTWQTSGSKAQMSLNMHNYREGKFTVNLMVIMPNELKKVN